MKNIGLILWLIPLLLASQAKQTIIIEGKKKRIYITPKASRTTIFIPQKSLEKDPSFFFKQDSSAFLPQTEDSAISKFTIPRIRGEESKFTEIYFEDILIQDPYTGLSLVNEFDNFDMLVINKGISSYDLFSINPICSVQFKLIPHKTNKGQLEINYGKPYGTSLITNEQIFYKNILYKIFAKFYQTKGNYLFYNDNATPYNIEDDYYSEQKNNDQKSIQFMPFIQTKINDNTFKVISRYYNKNKGVPSLSPVQDSHVRQKNTSILLIINWKHRFKSFLGKSQTSLTYNNNFDNTKFTDPEGSILFIKTSLTDVRANSVIFTIKSQEKPVKLAAGVSASKVNVLSIADTKTTDDLSQLLNKFFIGGEFLFFNNYIFEAKGIIKNFIRENFDKKTSKTFYGNSLGFSFVEKYFLLYLQYGLDQRNPSLLEEFGNGGNIISNNDLTHEDIQHLETGGAFTLNLFYGGVSLYNDFIKNKISFVPSSLNIIKAVNLRSIDLKGIDVSLGLKYSPFNLYLTLTRLYPYYIDTDINKLVPNVSTLSAAINFKINYKSYYFHWISKYRSAIYRDINNNIIIPERWIHDLKVNKEILKTKLEISLYIKNISNVRYLEIYSSPELDNQDKGYTAYTDIMGHPLPGRTWVFSLVYNF